MPSLNLTRVFVYGTLKRGDCRHAALADQQFLGVARTQPGYRLYDLGSYPGLVEDESATHCIDGEVYAVTPSCLHRLDTIEGVDEGLYERRTIQLMAGFDDAPVSSYFYLGSVHQAIDIGCCWKVPPR